MPQVRIVAKNFMDMVAALPAVKLDKLYESTFICEAVLRSLPPLAKKYVLQMLFIDSPLTAKSMEEWVLPDGVSKHKVAVDRLLQLRVFLEVNDRKRESTYLLNPKFQGNIKNYILLGGTLPREPLPSSVTARLPALEELESYALEQWECFLLQLISSGQVEKSTSFSSSMMRVFQRGLLNTRENEAPRLTENGFQFLLMDTNAQLWYITREYISTAEDRGVDPTDLISFLLELSFHTVGEAYSLSTLSDIQRSAIKDFADLGLVKLQQGRKESWFIPTKLAINLSMSLADSSPRKQGFVVVETNFRMYAYSSSKLHCEILRLFSRNQRLVYVLTLHSSVYITSFPVRFLECTFFLEEAYEGLAPLVLAGSSIDRCYLPELFKWVEYQLPNLIVGAITKESLYNAFDHGITAEQIVSFLQQNAHPRVAGKIPSVPENVSDQIRLWETDRNRVEMIPSHLYDDFPSKEVYEAVCDFARELGGFLWDNPNRMQLIVRGDLHQDMRDFLRRQK